MAQTILVADDDPHLREVVRYTLAQAGFEVTEARDGKEALEKIRVPRAIPLALGITLVVYAAVTISALLSVEVQGNSARSLDPGVGGAQPQLLSAASDRAGDSAELGVSRCSLPTSVIILLALMSHGQH